MIQKVAETIKTHGMLKEHDRIIVAISGGPDSVALLNILMTLSEGLHLTLIMAYLNHGLRGSESAMEESFVRQLSQSLSLPLESKTTDIASLQRQDDRGMSIEEIGREERYRFLFDIYKKHSAQKIALGHHFNDQGETILMNFIRGSGLEGLKGISPVRDGIIIRPLIECAKEEILKYLKSRNLSFVFDTSNVQDIYLRNKIRNRLIPEIKEIYNPKFEKGLHNMAQIVRLENDFIKSKTDEAMDAMHIVLSSKKFIIDIPLLLSHHEAIQNRVIKNILQRFSPQKKGISFIHIQALRQLILSKNIWSSINLPFCIEARREYDELSICQRPNKRIKKRLNMEERKQPIFQCDHIEIPGEVKIREEGLTIKFDFIKSTALREENFKNEAMAFMDYDRINPPLKIRNMIPGDRIQPLGLDGSQKLKSFFINHKVPRNKRYKIPILVDSQSIIWIVGMRLSDHVKVTDQTCTIVKAEII